jgi:hypothetical protein
MNKNLQLVRDFHQQFGIAQPEYPETAHLSDMDIVMRQALLFQCGQETFQAIAIGDTAKVLAGFVDLAYNALAAIACRGDEVLPSVVSWRQDGSVVSVVKALSDKINRCSSGETADYSALYADFDGAFVVVHNNLIANSVVSTGNDYAKRFERETLPPAPDLSANLYE